MKKFIHNLKDHGNRAPNLLVPVILKMFYPNSVIDFGCGTGNFLKEFKSNGIENVYGLDGEWVNKEMLYGNVNEKEFLAIDLEKPIDLNRKFDLAISFEVAEHLQTKSAEIFVNNLTKASDIIVFSAAIPKQEGQNHLNEQWATYWIEIFKNEGFEVFDIIRPLIWDIDELSWWYKQNSFVFIKVDSLNNYRTLVEKYDNNIIRNIVHPQLFTSKAQLLENFISGEQSIKVIFLALMKALYRKIGGG